ncbi:MAG TPA: hypothetical protein VFC11_02280 [Methylocella sp.]|nr:hypothetical protein [Methylocella sp.]
MKRLLARIRAAQEVCEAVGVDLMGTPAVEIAGLSGAGALKTNSPGY